MRKDVYKIKTHILFVPLFVLDCLGNIMAQSYPQMDDIIECTFAKNERDEHYGKGWMVWMSVDVYEGNMKDNYFSGFGKMVWATGESYEGEWENYLMSGFGKMIWNDSTIYSGYWKNDLMNGLGTVTYPDGSFEKGEWKDGKLIED